MVGRLKIVFSVFHFYFGKVMENPEFRFFRKQDISGYFSLVGILTVMILTWIYAFGYFFYLKI